MKKFTLLLFLITANFCLAQTWTTGVVSLTTDYTVEFEINQGSGLVTMTMIGPEDKWLGLGPGISLGMGMGNLDDDAIVYNSNGLEDRRMRSGTGTPPLDDASQDWSVSSDTTSGGLRTVVATRLIDTGDSQDYVFPTSAGSIPILWAVGNTLSFSFHSNGTRGGVVAGITLATPEFKNILSSISIVPNPALNNLNIKLPESLADKKLSVEVYDVLGKNIVSESLNQFKSSINVSKWNSGLYLVKISSNEENASVTKRFVKL